MARQMNPDLAEAAEQLASVTGMNGDQAQSWLATKATGFITKAHEMTRRKLIGGGSKRGPRRHSAQPRSRKRSAAAAGASE